VQISEYGTQFLRFGWTALRKVHIGPKLVADVMCIAQYLISQTQAQTVWHGVVDTVINAGQLGKFACTRNGFGIEQHNWSKVKWENVKSEAWTSLVAQIFAKHNCITALPYCWPATHDMNKTHPAEQCLLILALWALKSALHMLQLVMLDTVPPLQHWVAACHDAGACLVVQCMPGCLESWSTAFWVLTCTR